MFDLSAVMFFNMKFRVYRVESDTDMLWTIVQQIRKWMINKYNHSITNCIPTDIRKWSKFKKGEPVFSNTHFPYENEIQLVSEYFKEKSDSTAYPCEFWACTITEKFVPTAQFAPRVWTTELGYEQINENEAEISCVLSYRDRAGHIGPIDQKPLPTIPKIIGYIINEPKLKCMYGCDHPSYSAVSVSSGGWDDIWKRILSNERKLPYIILNPSLNDLEEIEYNVDPQKLAYALCGNAMIFYAENIDSTIDLLKTFPAEYRCERGNIRCYVPQCNPSQAKDSYRHRFLSMNEIESFGSEAVIEIFRRALVQNTDRYTDFFRVENVKSKREKYNRQMALQSLHQKYQTYLEQQKATLEKSTDALLIDEIKKQEELERERDEAILDMISLEDELQKQKNQNYMLNAQIESMRTYAEKGRTATKIENARSQCKRMNCVDDVVLYFATVYADRLHFTDSALKSLKECTLSISELWDWLYALANVMYDLFNKSEAGIDKLFQERTGIICGRGEGSQTRKNKKLMQQFVTEYSGETINVEMHLKSKDRSQALHFGFSRQKQKLVIDHCGVHLTNSLTRNRS